MSSWNLTAGDPLSLTLAADVRLSQTDYTDDQIWELHLRGGEPAALALETTFGLRAHRMRLFPRFLSGNTQRTDPASFYQPPRVVRFFPNYIAVECAPFEGLEVLAEYWMIDSHLVSGRLRLSNLSILPQYLRLEWVALLTPLDRQGGMAPIPNLPGQALAGETSNLQPVVVVSGGPKAAPGPYPALATNLEMYPGSTRLVSWAAAGLHTQESALEAAQQAIARPWDAEITRLEMTNLSQGVWLDTGDREWDATFALAQKTAFGLFVQNKLNLPEPSLILTRRPDQGFSLRGDGGDHPLPWNGQSALDAYYLTSFLLPGAPHLAAGLLRNFLSVQDEVGRIDGRPGLGGQRTRRLAQPILAALAVKLGDYLNEGPGCPWYAEVYAGLRRFFQAWLSPDLDIDGDGLPEWESPLQSGLEDSPIFERFSPDARGLETPYLESPALAAFLFRECRSLIEMAEALLADPAARGLPDWLASDLPYLYEVQQRLQNALDETWDELEGIYRYRDAQTHLSPGGMSLVSFQGPGVFTTRRRFKQARRLAIRLETREDRTAPIHITVRGFTPDGEVSEEITPAHLSWLGSQGYAITRQTYLAIEQVEVRGLGSRDRGRVFTPDYTQEDCGLLLPLWAGAVDPERARRIVETTLLTRFLQPYGIPISPGQVEQVSMPWNDLIGEGLLLNGYRAEAAQLITHLMNSVVPILKQQQAFVQSHSAISGQPAGERGHLHGLPPLGLFLQTLGIRSLHPKQIMLHGFNPLERPVTVQYRKAVLTCHPGRTEITFPGGQHIVIDQPGLHRVTLS